MPDEARTAELGLPLRVRHGLRRPANWLSLMRFSLVGASGYVINLTVFALERPVATPLNFAGNKLWSFRA